MILAQYMVLWYLNQLSRYNVQRGLIKIGKTQIKNYEYRICNVSIQPSYYLRLHCETRDSPRDIIMTKINLWCYLCH